MITVQGIAFHYKCLGDDINSVAAHLAQELEGSVREYGQARLRDQATSGPCDTIGIYVPITEQGRRIDNYYIWPVPKSTIDNWDETGSPVIYLENPTIEEIKERLLLLTLANKPKISIR